MAHSVPQWKFFHEKRRLNPNYDVIFRQFSGGSPGGASLPPKRAVLLAFALATTLAIALAATGAALHDDGPGHAAVPNTEPYPPAGGIQPILDLAASALLPGYAFAQSPPDSTPPTFVSSTLNATTGVLAITFSEDIDATPVANVVPTKIHVRESGSYTGGVTLSAGELDTTVDGTIISFTLTASHLAAVNGLAVPELTIEPGAVKDTSGDLIVGTFDLSTAVFADSTFSVSTQGLNPRGMAFSSNGTNMFVVDYDSASVYAYTLSTPFDISAPVFVNSFNASSQDTSPNDVAFSNDGTKMFVVGYENEKIFEYTLTPAFGLSSVTLANNITITQDIYPDGMAFSNDGTKMFVAGEEHDSIYEYAMSTAFDVSTANFTDTAFSVTAQETSPTGMEFSSDGTKMFVVGFNKTEVHQYALSTPFDISAPSIVHSFNVSSQDIYPEDVTFSNDGAKMFVVGNNEENINEYALSSIYPITIADDPAPDFVTTWRTDAANESVTIPVQSSLTYNYTVIWGDGTNSTGVTGNADHTYAAAGDYQVRIYGTYPGIYLNNHADASKLISIDQWGSNRWASMASAFRGASNMGYNATDTPDLSGVTSMRGMFDGATSFNGDISGWNVSGVTDMSYMFFGATSFNGDISGWNVSGVTNMSNMFFGATSFNGDISDWNVSGVTNMFGMFHGATSFNGDISGWNVSGVTNMATMFNGATSFNGDISDWNVSVVTDISNMFNGATSFNSDISDWNVSGVTNMGSMFLNATSFNSDISDWNVSGVTNMGSMFLNATSFSRNLGNWYIVLDDTAIDLADAGNTIGSITAQNSVLDGHGPVYGLGSDSVSQKFAISGSDLQVRPGEDYSSGTYDVAITATGAGLFGTSNQRTVGVTVTDTTQSDTTPPTLALIGSDTETITVGDTYTDAGATCTDTVDGTITPTSSGTVNTGTAGTYTLTYSCSDAAGNDATPVEREVIVEAAPAPDTTPPTLALIGLSSETITVGASYTDAGATCTDTVDGTITPTSSGTVDASHAGTYTLTYSCSDAAGNSAPDVSRIVTVQAAPDTIKSYEVSGLIPVGNITDGGNLELDGARGITTFKSGSNTYVAVASEDDNGVQILDVTDPDSITPTSQITDAGNLELDGPRDITTFKSGSNTYVAVASYFDDGVQILDVTDPGNVTATSQITDAGSLELDGVYGITTFKSGSNTYVAVASYVDDGVQILDVTDPDSITPTSQITDGGSLELSGPRDITTFKSGSNTYVAVASYFDDGVQILDVTDPGNVTATSQITDGDDLVLDGASGITTFKSGSNTYVAVASEDDDGVQILDVTDPGNVTATSQITDGDDLVLDGARGITTFKSGSNTYVAVASYVDNGVQILDVTDPGNVTATAQITYRNNLLLAGPYNLISFELNNGVYIAVASYNDNGVQILKVDGALSDTTAPDTTAPDTTAPVITLAGPASVTITVGATYDDEGAACTDDVDASLAPTVSADTVDAGTVGTYAVTYACVDAAGNQADPVSRTVIVEAAPVVPDTTAPVITLAGPASVTITVGATYDDEGAACTDDVDASLAPTVSADTVDAGTVGTYAVTYACVDAAGNQADPVSRTVIVEAAPVVPDTTAPVITLAGPASVTITVGATYDDEGAACTDDVDASLAPTVSADTVDAGTVGTYAVTYACVDAAGNQADPVSRTVIVEAAPVVPDTTAPVITLAGPASVTITVGATYDDEGAACTDDVDASLAPTVSADTVDAGTVGTYAVTYACVDAAGNQADPVSRTVIVSAAVINTGQNPPTFVSSTLDATTGVLAITFSEDIDATPAANVVPTKIHVRESGNYTGGVTLSASELATTADGTVISFNLTESNLAAVNGLDTPKLTIEPGAVRDTSGDLIVGTFDVSTAAFVDALSVSSQDTDPRGMAFSSDGTKMFVIGTFGDNVNEYALSVAFDVSTANFTTAFDVSQDNRPRGMAFSSDGTRMFVVGNAGANVNEYALTPPFDISTANFTTDFDVSSQELYPTGMAFSSDGTKMFVIGTFGDDVNEYALSVAFDISTAVFANSTFSVALQETVPEAMAFSSDGTKMFVVGRAGANVNEYALSEAFDVSTANFTTDFDVSSQDTIPTGMAFSNDGAKMFVIGTFGDDVNEYALSSVYPITVTADATPSDSTPPTLSLTGSASITITVGDTYNDEGATCGDDVDGTITPTSSGTVDASHAGTYTLTYSCSDTAGNDATPVEREVIVEAAPSDSIRPTVNVGPSQTVREGAAVSMPWTAGIPSGETPSYSWSQNPASPAVTLASQNSPPTTFTAPQVDADTEFTFTLAVTAGQHTVEDSLTITVKNNRPPTADAGSDRIVNERTAVTLSGSARDLDGDKMTYAWTQDSGTSVDLTGSNTTRLQFTAPGITTEEGIIFRFTATDTAGESANDTVTIRVRDVPITVSSATYSRSGTMTITFNQDIRDSPSYDLLHIRNASSDTGGIALSDVADKSHSGRTITVMLDPAQQDRYGALQSPQLDIDRNAVTDADGVGIEETLDIPIRTASSGKRSHTPPPAIDLDALASRGVDIPPHIADLASSRDKSGPIRPMAPDGTFDFLLVIDENGYALHSHASTVVPTNVTAGQPVTIKVTMHDPTPIAYFAIYLNLQGDSISHLQSDAQVVWDSGEVRVTDPNGLMRDASITMSTDPDDPAKKTATITVTFSEGMGDTNMVIRTWNVAGQLTEVQIFDALAVAPPEPEPVMMDPEPGAEQNAVDPEPGTVPDAADSEPAADSSDDRALLAIRMWSGFEPESITDAQLLALLGLDYPGVNIPNWVMTELGPLVAKERITVDQFVLALTYILENS